MNPLADFNGTAPLFPLPNVALFPHVVQPLHMFEPRYRQMTADVLDGNRLLALAVLRPGHDDAYNRKDAPIYDTVCLGRITGGEKLPDGRYNATVQGLARARVTGETPTDDLYRVAELELLPEDPVTDCEDLSEAAAGIVDAFGQLYPQLADHPAVRKMLESDLPFGVLCDFITHAVEIDVETAARVLCECDLAARGLILTTWLGARLDAAASRRPFPPAFSVN